MDKWGLIIKRDEDGGTRGIIKANSQGTFYKCSAVDVKLTELRDRISDLKGQLVMAKSDRQDACNEIDTLRAETYRIRKKADEFAEALADWSGTLPLVNSEALGELLNHPYYEELFDFNEKSDNG